MFVFDWFYKHISIPVDLLVTCIKTLDKDGDGKITIGELAKEIKQFIKSARSIKW